MNNTIDGVLAYVKKLFVFFLIIAIVVVIAAGAAAYFGFKLNDYIIAKELLKSSILTAQAAADLAAQNATMVMPR
jgi:hypothetical protein